MVLSSKGGVCNAPKINNLLLIYAEIFYYYFKYFWQKVKNKTNVMNYYFINRRYACGHKWNKCLRLFAIPQEEKESGCSCSVRTQCAGGIFPKIMSQLFVKC